MFCSSTNVQWLRSYYVQTYTLFLTENILLGKTSRLGMQKLPFVTVFCTATAEHITPRNFLSVSMRRVLTTEITVVTICTTYFNKKNFALVFCHHGVISLGESCLTAKNPNYAVEGRALTLCIREVPV